MSNPGILWQFPANGAARMLAPTEAISVSGLYGPWPLVLQYHGRTVLSQAGYYLEYRTAASAPDGWAAPVVGVDNSGQPAAVRVPLAPPPPPQPDPETRETALAALAERIEAEFVARVHARAGSMVEWVYRTGRAVKLQMRQAADTITEDERVELAGLMDMQEDVERLRAYAWQPMQPSMWGPAPENLADTLYGWVAASALNAAEVALVDVQAPPVQAPQWPVLGA